MILHIESEIIFEATEPVIADTFDSTEITFDSTDVTFDQG